MMCCRLIGDLIDAQCGKMTLYRTVDLDQPVQLSSLLGTVSSPRNILHFPVFL